MNITLERKIIIPTTPNFIMLEMPVGIKQNGFVEGDKISIGDLSDEQLKLIGEEWTKNLIESARSKRNEK